MDTDSTPWGWGNQLGFTLTVARGLTPEQIFTGYGADPATAETLTRRDALDSVPPQRHGDLLRVGSLTDWGFCFEEVGPRGTRREMFTRLSARTEVLSLSRSPGMSHFQYFRDQQRVEAFEPGITSSVRGPEPHLFWLTTLDISRTRALPPRHAVLEAIADHIGGRISREVLEGALLTAVPPTEIPAIAGPTTESGVAWQLPGRHLGSWTPPT